MRYIIFPLLAVLLLTSCNTINLVTIDVRNPATITFPPDVTNVLIVDNTPVSIKDNNEKKEGDEPSILTVDSAKTILLKSLNQFMNEEKYFSKVETYPYHTNGSDDLTHLTERKVQSLCNEREADALISLDLFTISGQLESEITGYMGSYRMLGTKLGILVSTYSKDGTPYRKPIVQLDSLYREESVDWSRVNSSILPLNDLIVEISVKGADNLTGKFIPSWQQQERWYYSSKSSKMKDAEKLVKTTKWKEAADIWTSLYNNEKNSKKKIRLASNIALAYEYIDDIDNAQEWIKKAYDLLPPKSSSDLALQVMAYKSILDRRVKAMPVLHEQLGIDDTAEDNQDMVE